MSGVSGSKTNERTRLSGSDLVLINQDHKMHKVIRAKSVSGLGALASLIHMMLVPALFHKQSSDISF